MEKNRRECRWDPRALVAFDNFIGLTVAFARACDTHATDGRHKERKRKGTDLDAGANIYFIDQSIRGERYVKIRDFRRRISAAWRKRTRRGEEGEDGGTNSATTPLSSSSPDERTAWKGVETRADRAIIDI